VRQAKDLKRGVDFPLFAKAKLSKTADSESALIKEILDFHPALIVGETHDEQCSRQFMLDHLAELKKQGVTTLFLEHLITETMQPYLDDYEKSLSADLPPALDAYLATLELGYKTTGYRDLVKAAMCSACAFGPLTPSRRTSCRELQAEWETLPRAAYNDIKR